MGLSKYTMILLVIIILKLRIQITFPWNFRYLAALPRRNMFS